MIVEGDEAMGVGNRQVMGLGARTQRIGEHCYIFVGLPMHIAA
jgi:hypothetical protein